MEALDAVLRAREMLMDVTPLRRDCGGVCGAACCACDEDGQGGMLLFPGEDALYDPLPPGFSITRDDAVMPGMKLLTCAGRCDRSLRPLACRMFPLTPVLTEDGRLRVRVDPRSFSVCPLSEYGVRGMDRAFGQTMLESARILNQCPEHRAYFQALTAYFERLRTW